MTGLCVVVGGASATLLAGVFMKKFVNTKSGAMKMCIVGQLLNLPTFLIFLKSCPTLTYVGINVVAPISSHPLASSHVNHININDSCSTSFDPVCASNKLMYFSPCHGRFSFLSIVRILTTQILAGCQHLDDQWLLNNC